MSFLIPSMAIVAPVMKLCDLFQGVISFSSDVARVAFEILQTHCSWLGNGPEDKLPSSPIAYQPGLMLRMSDSFH
jgi:hypothetical protein